MKYPKLAKQSRRLRVQLNKLNSRLEKDSWRNYHKFMLSLFASYEHLDYVKYMSGLLRSKKL